MTPLPFWFLFLSADQVETRAILPKPKPIQVFSNPVPDASGPRPGANWTPSPPAPADTDLRLLELQALISHYHRLCDTLLDLELEHELAVIDTGADHPEKGRGLRRIEVIKNRKEETRRKIETIRKDLGQEAVKPPARKLPNS